MTRSIEASTFQTFVHERASDAGEAPLSMFAAAAGAFQREKNCAEFEQRRKFVWLLFLAFLFPVFAWHESVFF